MVRSLSQHVATYHLTDQPLTIGLSNRLGGNVLTISQHAHKIADTKNLIHPMRYINDGRPPLLQATDQSEQLLTVVNRKRTGGLIKNDDSRVDPDRGGNLYHLLLAGSQFGPRRMHIHIDPDFPH